MIELVAAVSRDSLQDALLGPVGFLVAFVVGTVSFFSPCILPLIPGYLSFVSGLTGEQLEGARARRRVVAGTGLFVLGFTTMFTLLGVGASAIGSYFLDHLDIVARVAGAIVIVFGLAFIAPGLLPFLERERRPFLSRARPGLAGAYPLGLAFAVGWTPCVGPGLGVMLDLGAASGSVTTGAFLLFWFSLGFGVWFVLAGVGMRRALAASEWMRRHARALQIAGGVMMVLIGVLLVTGQWESLIAPLRRMINRFTPPV